MLPDSLRNFFATPTHTCLSVRRQLAVFALYLILAVLYTYPLAFNISTHIPGQPGVVDELSDSALQTWYPWWVRKALLSPEESVLHSNWVFFPVGMEMTMQPAMFLHGAMTVPLFWLDITTANNIVIIVSFALSGLAGCLLGLYVCKSLPGALFCGFIFAFCPYKFQHIDGHYHLMATETLPLVALSLIRLYDRPSGRHLVWAGVWLGITIFTDYYYFAYALLLFGFIAIYWTVTSNERLRVIRQTVLTGLLALVVASPLLIPALSSAANSDYGLASGHGKHRADLLSPFVPSVRQWIGSLTAPVVDKFVNREHVDGVEHSVYIGWALLLLCGVFARRLWRSGGNPRLFLIGSAVFFLLALGPDLSINGHNVYGASEWSIPLPGWVLMQLPIFEGARAPSRIVVVAMMCIAVCAGNAVNALLSAGRIRSIRPEYGVAALVIITALEYILPIRLSEIQIPQTINDMRKDPEPGIVVNVPLTPSKSTFIQPYHGRKVLSAKLGRKDTDIEQYYWRHEALQYLTLPHWTTSLPTEGDSAYLVDLLGIRYVIIDKTVYSPERSERARDFIRRTYGLDEIYNDDDTSILRLSRSHRSLRNLTFRVTDPQADLHLAYGWSNREAYGPHTVAWIVRKHATIAIPPVKAGSYHLTLNVLSLMGSEQRMGVSVGSKEIDVVVLTPGTNELTLNVDPDVFNPTETNLIHFYPNRTVDVPHFSGRHERPVAKTPIEVTSGGYFTVDYGVVRIAVGDTSLSTYARGWIFAAVDTLTGRIVESRHFKGLDTDMSTRKFKEYLDSLPEGMIVAVAKRSVGFIADGTIGEALVDYGFSPDFKLNPFNSFAAILERNGRPPLFSTGAALASVAVGQHPTRAEGAIGLIAFQLKSTVRQK